MQTDNVPAPSSEKKGKTKIIRGWLVVVGSIGFWIVFWILVRTRHPISDEDSPVSLTGSKSDLLFHVVFHVFFGLFFLGAGIAAYLVATLTQCFTLDFTTPVWESIKVRMWLANLVVLIASGLGVGFLASTFLTPILTDAGLSSDLAGFLPVMGGVGVVQLVFIWILLWAPMEKRIIAKRLSALGITAPQLQTGIYLGLSDPAQKSIAKRFGAIEEDMGMLWFTPEQMIYYGDTEQLGIRREQLLSTDRQVDGRSTTALSGTAHVVLSLQLADGTRRQIRLHTEGVRTMGGKRKAMDQLSAQIEAWRVLAAPASQA